MLAAWLKALHIVALALWGGGLLALPGLILREHRVTSDETADLGALWRHRVSRFAYDVIVSPAAIVAVGSGTALIFVTRPLEGWFFLKLAAVAGLVVTHMVIGRFIDRFERPELQVTRSLAPALLMAATFFVCLILWLVLQKPAIPDNLFPGWLLERPGDAPFGQSGSSATLMPT